MCFKKVVIYKRLYIKFSLSVSPSRGNNENIRNEKDMSRKCKQCNCDGEERKNNLLKILKTTLCTY